MLAVAGIGVTTPTAAGSPVWEMSGSRIVGGISHNAHRGGQPRLGLYIKPTEFRVCHNAHRGGQPRLGIKGVQRL